MALLYDMLDDMPALHLSVDFYSLHGVGVTPLGGDCIVRRMYTRLLMASSVSLSLTALLEFSQLCFCVGKVSTIQKHNWLSK